MVEPKVAGIHTSEEAAPAPEAKAHTRVRKEQSMHPFELIIGFCVLVLGLAFLSRTFDGPLRFTLLVAFIATSGLVLGLKTDF